MKIGTRILLGYVSILTLLVGLAVVSSSKVDSVSTNLSTINTVNSVKQRYAINFRGSVHDRAILTRDILLLDDRGDIKATLDGIRTRVAAYATSAAALDQMMAAKAKIFKVGGSTRGGGSAKGLAVAASADWTDF
jgi:methyl-accepting chemotaxis protein